MLVIAALPRYFSDLNQAQGPKAARHCEAVQEEERYHHVIQIEGQLLPRPWLGMSVYSLIIKRKILSLR